MAARNAPPGDPQPFAKGAFAMYPMEDGGVMVVSNVEGGPMEGVHHHRIPPNVIRGAAALMGGNPIAAVKGVLGFGKRKKAIEQ